MRKVVISSSASSTSSTSFSKTQQNGNGKSFLRWFKKKGNIRENNDDGAQASRSLDADDDADDDSSSGTLSAPRSPTLSLSSHSSRESLNSTTTTGFAFIPPDQYNPFGNATQPEKRIAPGPVTDTYRQRIRAHERTKEHDRLLDLTLRKKYNIFDADTLRPNGGLTHSQPSASTAVNPYYNDLSLPNHSTSGSLHADGLPDNATRCRPKRNRRTVSDSCKDRKAGAYVHVKGKRKAPSPPTTESDKNSSELSNSSLSPSMSTLARKKRQAPPPPMSPTGAMSLSATSSTSLQSAPPDSPQTPTSSNGGMTTVLSGGLFDESEMQAIMNGRPYSPQKSEAIPVPDKPKCVDGVECTDTLKLERGILRSNRDLTITSPPQSPNKALDVPTSPTPRCVSPISPRPWYKRSSVNNKDQSIPFKREITLKTMDKRKNKDKANKDSSPPLPEVGYSRSSSIFDSLFTRVIASHHTHHHDDHADKRRSGIGMPNISELDREAAEIINKEKENERNRAQAANDKYYEAPADTEPPPVPSQERRSSTKDLINRFEDTNQVKFTLNTAFVDKADRYFSDNVTTTAANTKSSSNVTTNAPATKDAPTKNRLLSSTSSTGSSSSALSSASSSSMVQRIFSSAQQTTNVSKNNPNTPDAPNKPATAVQPDTQTAVDKNSTGNNTAPATPTASLATAATWICAYCTLENFNWRVICEVCERIRPYDKTRAPLATADHTAVVPTPRYRYAKIDAAPHERNVNASASNVINNSSGTGDQFYKSSVITGGLPTKSVSETSVCDPTTQNRFTSNDQLGSPKLINKMMSNGLNPRNSELIDSSEVITTKPAVYVAPHPAAHDHEKKVSSNSPDLDAMRAVRIAKFTDEKRVSPDERQASLSSLEEQHVKPVEKPLLTDRGSLEREKQRLRDMIREMNAKTLENKHPVNSNAITSEPPPPKAEEARSIEVGQGAIKKVFARKSESPDNKVISDQRNYTNKVTDKENNIKCSLPKNLNLKARQIPPDTLLLLPSPITEISEDDLTPSSATSQALVDQQIDSIYAQLKTDPVRDSVEVESHRRNTAKGLDEFRATLKFNRNRTNTVELNKLLKELEMAIGEGEHELAAKLAMDLARMKVSLSVTKQSKMENQLSKEDDSNMTDARVPSTVSGKDIDITESKSTQSNGLPLNIYNKSNNAEEVDALVEGATALPLPNESNSDTLSFGWTCPLCTLINSPNRPGCVACSEARPPNYVVPAAYKVKENNDMPAELLKFLNDDDDNLPSAATKDILRNKDLSPSTSLQPKNDLNKTTANRKSAEIFNIIIAKEDNAIPDDVPNPATKNIVQTQIVMTAITESPNITKSRYRGVDNYNPHIKQQPTKTSTPYKSPIVVNPIVKPLRANKLPQLVGVIPKKTAIEVKVTPLSPPIKISTPAKMADIPKESNEHYTQLLHLDNSAIVTNSEPFECSICIGTIAVGAGVVLRDCIHTFCRECIVNTVTYSEEAEVKCPYIDNDYSCDSMIQEREIRALLTREAYDRHLAISLKVAEHRAENAFHCRTPGCKGWCVYEDNVNEFKCPICRIVNCLTCRVIHDGLNCKQYQDRMNSDCDTSQEARRTGEMLEEMIEKGEAMKCPICQVILMKKWGCDWLKCSMCKTEICWVTRGIRWGPEGKGDTSAGCRCGVNGVKCHPKCNYCH